MVENELRSQEEASLKLATTQTGNQFSFGANAAQRHRWRFKSEMTAQYFERQMLPPLLSANQELRNQTHFRFIQTHSHTHYYTLLYEHMYSLTHTSILSCINIYTLSHTHYYTLSHKLLYSLTYTTIHSHTCM